MGEIIANWDTRVVLRDPKLIDWDRVGVYRFELGEAGLASLITHRPTGHRAAVGKRTPHG